MSLHQNQTLAKAMVASGWCSHQVEYLAQRFPSNVFRHLAALELQSQRLISHDACTDATCCTAYNTSVDASYETRHDGTCPDPLRCSFLPVPYERLTNVIRKGQIPLVRLDISGANYTLQVKGRGPGTAYTAMSHVWADGLGNPSANALPICQVLALTAHLDQLTQSTGRKQWFWIDTLCIPVKPIDSDLRIKCIGDMSRIYREASRVLVLDRELMGWHFDRLDDYLARIICSVWMSRCWTLQEGVLSEQCVFAFARGYLIATRSILQKQIKWSQVGLDVSFESNELPEDSVGRHLLAYLDNDFFSIHQSRHALDAKFIASWNALAGRSTTKPEDLYSMLAILLDLDCQKLLKIPQNERLAAIIGNLDRIPLSLLFSFSPHSGYLLPTQLSRDILVSDASFTRTSRRLRLKNPPKGVKSTCSFYRAECPRHNHRFTMHTVNGAFEITCGPYAKLPPSKPRKHITCDKCKDYVCIAIEDSPYDLSGDYHNGALFHVVSWDDKRDDFLLDFCCPIDAERFPSSSNWVADLYAYPLRRRYTLILNYDLKKSHSLRRGSALTRFLVLLSSAALREHLWWRNQRKWVITAFCTITLTVGVVMVVFKKSDFAWMIMVSVVVAAYFSQNFRGYKPRSQRIREAMF